MQSAPLTEVGSLIAQSLARLVEILLTRHLSFTQRIGGAKRVRPGFHLWMNNSPHSAWPAALTKFIEHLGLQYNFLHEQSFARYGLRHCCWLNNCSLSSFAIIYVLCFIQSCNLHFINFWNTFYWTFKGKLIILLYILLKGWQSDHDLIGLWGVINL